MAQAPQRPPTQAPRTPSPTQAPARTPAPAQRREPDPDEPPVKTVGQEQYERSRQAEDDGPVDNDERQGGRQQQVRGVSRTQVDDGDEVPGTPYTPPEGHTEMNPAPGEPGGPTAGHYPDEEADAQRSGQDRRGDRQEDRQSRR